MNAQPCPRCGKQNPADIHTCTPLALKLADWLDDLFDADGQPKQAAAEMRRLWEAQAHANKVVHKLADRVQADTALLRQALEALDWIVTGRGQDTIEAAHAALKERLGENK